VTDQQMFDQRRGLHQRTALYRLYDADDALLYVGITKNIVQRWFQHSQTKTWWSQAIRREVAWLDDRPAALLAERRAILAEHPIHNPVPPGWTPTVDSKETPDA
jgi:hypothetical protein